MFLMISLIAARSGTTHHDNGVGALVGQDFDVVFTELAELRGSRVSALEVADDERRVRAAAASASVVLREGASLLAAAVGAASSFLDEALPIRSFSMVETSSASAIQGAGPRP